MPSLQCRGRPGCDLQLYIQRDPSRVNRVKNVVRYMKRRSGNIYRLHGGKDISTKPLVVCRDGYVRDELECKALAVDGQTPKFLSPGDG